MSLDQYTGNERHIIDLTTNPPQRYADRFALPGTPPTARAASRPPVVATPAIAPARPRTLQIDLLTVFTVSALTALGMLLVGIVVSALY
jgi:hypothetical protein